MGVTLDGVMLSQTLEGGPMREGAQRAGRLAGDSEGPNGLDNVSGLCPRHSRSTKGFQKESATADFHPN